MAGRVVMVQGTTSHAGKSVLVAALCRIFAREGLRVAPFKAQNMALNSYVTPEGGEIGRAQAYQADAAGLEPHVDMNPVLLKPNSQTGSQVIVLGKPVGNMAVRAYHAYQPTVWPTVTAALDRLRDRYDLVVVEGAGSPAEINLRDRDIVNMKVARYADCPVLLVGDIDRGGVFASLVGTTLLVTKEERALIKAFIINKFRGDASLLDNGLEFLQNYTGIPTLGVIPYLQGWRGDEEDSLGVEDRRRSARKDAPLIIAVVRLPFISNFTDFDALADEEDVAVRYATRPEELAGADAILLPGTKSTIADLRWLRASGIAEALLHAGVPLVGICGGYQMLGTRIEDPHGVESDERVVEGLGLLPAETTFAADKRTIRVEGEALGSAFVDPGTPTRGYEIHMGRTTLAPGVSPLLRLRNAEGAELLDGAVSPEGRVAGTYLHGLFDHPTLRRCWLNRLRARKDLAPLPVREDARSDHDRLADHVAAYLDMPALRAIVLGG